jgi:hypothetical protein
VRQFRARQLQSDRLSTGREQQFIEADCLAVVEKDHLAIKSCRCAWSSITSQPAHAH